MALTLMKKRVIIFKVYMYKFQKYFRKSLKIILAKCFIIMLIKRFINMRNPRRNEVTLTVGAHLHMTNDPRFPL